MSKTKKVLPDFTELTSAEFLATPVQDYAGSKTWLDVVVNFAVGMAYEKRPAGFDSDFDFHLAEALGMQVPDKRYPDEMDWDSEAMMSEFGRLIREALEA